MNHGSLRMRLLLGGAASILAALILSALGLMLLFERHVERRVEAELGVHLDQIVASLDHGTGGSLIIKRPPADPRFAIPLSGLYWQLNADSNTILRSRSLWDVQLALPPDDLADGAVHKHRIAGPAGSELIVLERSITLPARLGGGGIRAAVAVDTADIKAAVRSFAIDLLPYLAVIAIFLISAAYAQVAIGLKPLDTVHKQLTTIRQGKARRLGRAFPDEILPLTAEVDALLDARETQIEKARARAGDLAHGFKTPLQVLAGDVARLRVKGECDIAAEIEQVATAMRGHVDRELTRARIASGNRDARAGIAEVVERVVAVIRRTPEGARLDWTVDIPTDAVARIDPDDLAEAIGNLVENAARHARKAVSIRMRREGDLTLLSVIDDGAGIPKERLDEALARGGKLDRLGGGAGLGLAIVREIAEAWGGYFEIHTSSAGVEANFGIQS